MPADRAPLALRIAAAGAAVVFIAPIVYVGWRTLTLGGDLGATLRESAEPLWRTLQLATIVSVATGFLGTALAWLLMRTDVPLARVWRVLAPLPLVFPSFVGAAAFLAGLAPDGFLNNLLEAVGLEPPRRFRGLGASCLVLTAFTYPYVYLPVAARISALPASIEESARLLGDGTVRLFVRVVLPALRSSILGGMLITFLYSLSEFGAVQLLGLDTLTRVVYSTRLLDPAQSFAAASLLVVLAIVVITGERAVRGTQGHEVAIGMRRTRRIALGWWRVPALLGVLTVLLVALVVPVVSLAQWAWRGFADTASPLTTLREDLLDLREPAWSTAWLGVSAAVVALVVVLPAALLAGRYRTRLNHLATGAVLGGFAVPSLVIALSLAFWSLNVPQLDRLYQTAPLLIAAYVVHYGAQAMRSSELAVATVPHRMRESARLLGASRLRRALTIELPLMRPGLLAGAGLVLLSTVKELPATLLLAPIGLETLATRVWGAFEGGFLAEAGLASLALVAASGVLTWVLVLRRADRLA